MKKIEDDLLLSTYLANEHIQKLFTHLHHPFQIQRYDVKEIVLHEGEAIDGLYIQISGRTKITTSVITGKALLLRFCSAVSIMGDIELIQNVNIQSHVSAEEKTDFIFINKHYVNNVLLHDIAFSQELLHHVTYKLQTCTTASRINLLASVETRFASYLCTIRNTSKLFGREIRTTDHHEIASLIGTTTRHLNRIIEKLSITNVIRKENKQIIVKDWESIERISNGLRYE
ncbi:Crp/Fnr family transcriptional regulator [Bacillus pseudomycoides]|uniref:Crp/Fnr family transcriptional regulator n=1 Tax=Bacillus pseudomycoides TaxID=64104 RepID=UPI000BEB34DE|nr:Crp/Fnr family transcriptional regulator [Bacillus pseudomycoides]PEB41720.1 transcriptional regulator [Bacillus pseudomycoides]PGD92804.1 transcriptional regulator [Bacillus pseudomycoides]PGE01394.1 transcriptional regulator [Bacillus pseudomycoides]PHE62259.1 transcriptional regulator [Bacillus pseudomycoides]PHG19014.1 transcriptional regulator [Bacillus pseudomycoides]